MKTFVAIWTFVGLLLTGAAATAQPAKPTIVLVSMSARCATTRSSTSPPRKSVPNCYAVACCYC
jgi:hypothetical protein